MILSLLLSCGEPAPPSVDRLVRASMALRGVRPSLDEIRRAEHDPGALDEIAREWLGDPRFGATVRDLHAEQLLVRIDTQPHSPPVGLLAPYEVGEIVSSLDEAPLMLIERIVTEGRPYTEILTTPTTMADPIVALAYGVPYDPAGPEWQEAPWPDGRPAAGILSDTTLWQRWQSSDTNLHRVRAAIVLDTLLCTQIDASGVGVVDPVLAEDAVRDDPACSGCHDVLDPVASAFWGFQRYILPRETQLAWRDGCPEDQAHLCYPLAMWDPALVDERELRGLPAPALDGVPVDGLAGLGRAVAGDPRFAECTARRFAGWLAQLPPLRVPAEEARAFAATLVEADFDARELALEIVLSDWFAAQPPLVVRPEQVDRAIEDLTGFTWAGAPGDGRWSDVRFAASDEHGLRTLMGGLDGWNTVTPQHQASPTRELAWEWVAAEAASVAVDSGRFPVPSPDGLEEAVARLHLEVLAERASDAQVEATVALFEGARGRSGDRAHAWKVVLTAMLLDSRWVTY